VLGVPPRSQAQDVDINFKSVPLTGLFLIAKLQGEKEKQGVRKELLVML
jgi:hypothetical protein